MKKIIYTILAILFTTTVFAQAELLQKANDAYTKQQYKQAIEDYNQILKTNLESPEVYFNLGNAYYKTGQYTLAILNYERAKLLAPDDEDITFNLQVTNQKVVDSIQELPGLFVVRWWNSIINSQTTDTWAIFSIISFIAFLVMLGFYFFAKTSDVRRITFWTGCFLIAFTIFTWTFAAKQKNRMVNHAYAIVMQPTVTVKSSPDAGGTNLFVVHEGLKVRITDKLGDWVEIRLADGNKGWLLLETIERI
ncbi:MAG TPA: tetratricopeptide repeat protein [Prolixibacteraceae bacterium]|nr:tetratricopeptide repeat protein [Prolixibacteraceae bacterium]